MKLIVRTLAMVLISGIFWQAQAQFALEFVRNGKQGALYPVVDKDSLPDLKIQKDGLYISERFSASAADFLSPYWVESTLNELHLFKNNEIEVLYLIPENEEEVLVVCRQAGAIGYLRLISLLEEPL